MIEGSAKKQKKVVFLQKKDMSISDKVRKELWAKSGNRCAICKAELFQSFDGNSFNFEHGTGGRETRITREEYDTI